MQFCKVVNNCELTSEGVKKVVDVQEEIIPVCNLVKVYRHIVNSNQRVIAYVWNCPVTKRQRIFYEELPIEKYERKMKSIAYSLGWEAMP